MQKIIILSLEKKIGIYIKIHNLYKYKKISVKQKLSVFLQIISYNTLNENA